MKIFKIVLLTMMILGGSLGFGLCKVIDETGAGQAVAPDEIPNRPMEDGTNLKAIQTAFDESDPRANVKRIPYHPDMTYKIRLREFMGSAIILPPGEKIVSYTLFEKHNFTVTPLSDQNPLLTNVFNVYARYHGADTNLIVHGESGNIYSFYLRVDSVKSPEMPDLVTYIEDPPTTERMEALAAQATFEEEKAIKAAEAEAKKKAEAEEESGNDYLKSLPTKVSPDDLNFAYILKGGNDDIKPIRVFDDGHFTFFQYGQEDLDHVQTLPTVYRVVEGYDTPVNTRISGGCIVAETTNAKWTLRSGETHFCVWKDE